VNGDTENKLFKGTKKHCAAFFHSIYGTVLLFDTLLPMNDLQKLTLPFALFDTIPPI